MKKLLSLLILCCFSFFGFAQNSTPENNSNLWQQKIESLTATSSDESIDLQSISSSLQNFIEHPINLNNTSVAEISQLPFLNQQQIVNLFIHIKKYGKLISMYELQSIDGWDLEDIQRIIPYVVVRSHALNDKLRFRSLFYGAKSELIMRNERVLEPAAGYIKDSLGNTKYLGNANQTTLRYRFTSKNLGFGLIGEKDAGEQFAQGAQKNGFDFYSGYFQAKQIGLLKNFIVGDYNMQFGQGISMWTNRAFNKTSDVFLVKKSALGGSPYFSTLESNFLRGITAELGDKNWSTSLFYSSQNLDASVNYDSLNLLYLGNLNNTGLHRTLSENQKINQIAEKIYGIIPSFTFKTLQISGCLIQKTRNLPIHPIIRLDNQFGLDTFQTSTQYGFSYDLLVQNMRFYGEISKNSHSAVANLHGLLISLHPKVSFSLLVRHYPTNFISIYGNPFREALNRNENGVYVGFSATPNRMFKISVYADYFKFPWLQYTLSKPSHGQDYFVQIDYTELRNTQAYIRANYKNYEKNSMLEYGMMKPTLNHKLNVRFHFQQAITKTTTYSTRFEYTRLQDSTKEKGFLMYHDLSFRIHPKLKLTGRYALFDTESYNTRIYAYEDDLQYVFAISPFAYKGCRYYAIADYKLRKDMFLQAKLGQTVYSNQTEIGTGNDKISGNTKTEFKISWRWKF